MKSNGSSSSTISDSVVEFILTRDIKDFETLNVSSIAREFKINRSYLSQRFKCDKNYSLHEYILIIKLLRSVSVLESNKDITIEELSRKMGFASADYFRRVFKQRIGTTPGKYKNLFNKKNVLKKLPDGFNPD